eukprot:1636422-Alexandrium_andersonii.AAC.1
MQCRGGASATPDPPPPKCAFGTRARVAYRGWGSGRGVGPLGEEAQDDAKNSCCGSRLKLLEA